MDANDELFGMLRRSPFGLTTSFDPGMTAYDSQPAGIAPQGFIDELDSQFMTDFVLYGVYNGAFGALPALGLDTNIEAVTNELPGWPGGVTQVSGNAITAKVVADSASPSGHNLRFTIAAGAAGDEAYIETIVPVGGTRQQTFTIVPRAVAYRVTASGGAPQLTIAAQYLTASGATTGTGVSKTTSLSANATLYSSGSPVTYDPPADSAFLRLRVGVTRNTMAATDTATIDITDVRADRSGRVVALAEQTGGTTYGPGVLYQSAGVVWLQSNAYAGTGYPALAMGPANGVRVFGDTSTFAQIDPTTGYISLYANSTLEVKPGGSEVLALTVDSAKIRSEVQAQLKEIAAPSTPSSGYYAIYAKTDGKLYGKNDAGTEVEFGSGGADITPLILPDAITPTVSANTNNWAPTGLATTNQVSPDVTGATRTVTGFDATGFTQGQTFFLTPRTNDMILAVKSGSSTAGNRIRQANASAHTIGNGGGCWIVYDPAGDANNPFVLIVHS